MIGWLCPGPTSDSIHVCWMDHKVLDFCHCGTSTEADYIWNCFWLCQPPMHYWFILATIWIVCFGPKKKRLPSNHAKAKPNIFVKVVNSEKPMQITDYDKVWMWGWILFVRHPVAFFEDVCQATSSQRGRQNGLWTSKHLCENHSPPCQVVNVWMSVSPCGLPRFNLGHLSLAIIGIGVENI